MGQSFSSSSSKQKLSAIRIGIKALSLLFIFNFLMVLFDPLTWVGRLSIYNHLVPGRERLTYGDYPEKSYNLNLYNLDAMFNAHKIAGIDKSPDEYRVVLIGDSSTWGYLLKPEDTLAATINTRNVHTPDGRQITVYNLGYPVMSLVKDLLILDRTIHYKPDMIIWLVTLESFPYDKQFFPPLIQQNRKEVLNLIQANNLNMESYISQLDTPSLWDKTLIGQRRNLADIFRLQLYGVMWAATGIDHDIPDTIERPMEDLPSNESFHNLNPPHLSERELAFDVLQAGIHMAGDIPIIIVNEPMFISQGENSDLRYNYYYPRWAYDDYREIFSSRCASSHWNCLDLWDSISPAQFSNTAVHLLPQGVERMTNYLLDKIGLIIHKK